MDRVRRRIRRRGSYEPDSLLCLSDGADKDLIAYIFGYVSVEEVVRGEMVCRFMRDSARVVWEERRRGFGFVGTGTGTGTGGVGAGSSSGREESGRGQVGERRFDYVNGFNMQFTWSANGPSDSREAVIRNHLAATFDAEEFDDHVEDADDIHIYDPNLQYRQQQAVVPPAVTLNGDCREYSYTPQSFCDADGPRSKPSPFTKRYAKHLEFASALLFVLGSVLYLVCSVHDYEWNVMLLDLPMWLRGADDDGLWMRYRLQEEYGDVHAGNAAPTEGGGGGGARRGSTARSRWQEEFGSKKLVPSNPTRKPIVSTETSNRSRERNLQSTPAELYHHLDWTDLPPEIREAYAVLGYYEDSWNNAWPVAVDSMLWYQLTPEMQEAALFIGYTEEIWCSTDDGAYADDELVAEAAPATGSPTKPPTESPTPVPSAGPTASPAPPPSASPTLSPSGNPTSSPAPTLSGFILDEDGNVVPRPTASPSRVPTETPTSSPTGFPSVIPSWMPSFLPSVEPSVIPSSIPSEAPTPSPTGNITAGALLPDDLPDAIYFDEWWKDLPPEIQDAYTVLGWNETAWNTAMPVASDNMTWAELSEDQQEAAGVLGYTQEIWDAGVSDEFADIATNSTDAVDYEDYAWDELPPEVKAAAETLGWTQDKWDNGNGEAWSDAFYWSQLSPEAQEAAAVFGYDELSWNSGGDPELAALLEEAGGEYVSADDDYVFTIGRTGVYVSEYQILYFFAALCFVFTGILELAIYKAPFHFLMILAGVFGVASAVYVEEDVRLANILDSVSVHLFLFEGVGLLLKNRYKELMEEEQWTRWLYTFADSQFFLGAILDVIMSYFYLFEESADWDTALQITWVFSACLWVNCSLIYTGIFIKETIEDR